MTKIIGAKSGGGKQRKPVIAPDSLQSKVYIAMLYGLAEGEISGFATGDEQSIYLDDTPLKNANGEWNFQNVTVDFRHGTNDQTYIEGFPDVASEVAVNVELKHSTPWIKSFNNLDLDAVRVRLKWGALKQQNAENGDVSGVRIQYAIDLKIDNLAWQEVLNTEINAKTSTNYERSHRIDLPTAQRGWQIRVRRITPNSTSEYVSDKMYISAVTEVVDLKLRYPNTALLGLQYDAEHFSNVAKMAVRLKGLKIKVPSNYDPETRQYHGFWDGTFKREYSNNPAWIYYDICTADRYGLGERLKPFMVDKWSLYRLAQYCDEMVSDGNGGLEPRFTLNVYLQSADDAFAILSKMSGVFRAISYWNGQQIVCDADMPQDSMYSFSRANVIDGQFEYTGTRARDRHTVAKVAWDNKDNRFKTEYEFVRDEQAISKLGIKFVDIQAWGCTSKGQAQRAGWWALKSEQLETRMVSFKVGLDGYIPQPGKVIEISDELFAGRANGGRVSAINARKNIISLDRAITAKAGDKLIINSENGTAETRIIQTVQNHQVTVTQPFDNIAVENVWVLDSADLATMKFRVLSITQDEKHQFKITAVQYAPSKYDAIDTGAYIDERPISVINPKIQAPVTEVNIETEYRTIQGLNVATMIIHYPQVSGAVKYQVEWRKDNGNWIKLPITGANSVEIEGVYAGQYEARVTAISAFDVHSLATHSTLTAVQGKAGKPPKLAKITATGTLFGMKLDWAFSAKSEDTNYTEIQVSPDGRSNIATLGQFAYPTDTHQIQGLQGNLTQFYRAKIVDKLGNESDWTEWTSGTTSADPQAVLNILEGQINESTLDNILTGKINTAVTTGTANTQAILAEQQARTQAVTAEAQARVTAINNEAKARTAEINQRVIALNSEIGTTLAGLQNGLTQEIQQRKDGDNSTLANLNAYKVSNDRAISNVVERVNVAVSDVASNASKINALQSELNNVNNALASKASSTALNALTTCVTQQGSNITAMSNDVRNLKSSISTVQNGLTTKLDANVIGNYYTKTETDNVTAGKIDEFKSTLNRNDNLLLNSAFNGLQSWNKNGQNNRSSLEIINSNKRYNQVRITPLLAESDWKGINQIVQNIDIVNQTLQVRFVATSEISRTISIGIHYLSSTNTILRQTWQSKVVHNETECIFSFAPVNNENITGVRLIICESSDGNVNQPFYIAQPSLAIGEQSITAWSPSIYDSVDGVNANAQAINTINSNVSNLNNTVTSQGQAITQLNNSLNTTNANVSRKADSTALTALDNKVTQQGNNITSQANQITALQSGLNTANQNIATKLDGSVIVNYYTKAETDNVIGGKVEQFKATLDNTSLLPDPNMTDVNSWWSHYNYDFSQYLKTVTDGKVAPTVFRKDTRHSACWNYSRTSVPNNRSYKLSAWVRRSSNSVGAMYFTYRFLKAEDTQAYINAQYGSSGNITAQVPADENWHLVSIVMNLTHRADIAKIFFGFAIGHAQVGGWWELQGFRCEPVLSSNDMDNTVATATALQQTNTNVSNLNGQLTTQAQQITTLTTQQNSQSTTISQQTQTINGISAVRAVTVDNNGVISGYGLMSELRNGRVTSQFGVNADTFYIGSPTNGKKPFVFNASPRVIDGVSYPAGAWINSAYIANATIKNAHIQDSTLETAKIKDGAITNAKIANASIDNAKIKNSSIQTAHIQDLAVGEIKIAHGSVTVGSLVSGKINAVPSFTILEVANKKILMLLKIKAKTTIDNRFSSSNLQYNPAFIIKRNGKEIKRYNAYMKQVGLKGGYQRWEGGDGGFVISSVEYACEFDINEYLCDLNLTGRQIYSFEFIDDVENGKWDSKSTNFINSSSVEVVFLELKK